MVTWVYFFYEYQVKVTGAKIWSWDQITRKIWV